MLVGPQDNDANVYIVDFGIARRYKNPRNGAHIPFVDGKSVIGTVRYASLNTHLGIGKSFRFRKCTSSNKFFHSTDTAG
jgi:serine/threonine protein kinase